jgi:Flp pilus assembly pilin Flp
LTGVNYARSGEHALRNAALVFVADQCGQDLVDYGLLIATVAIVVLLGLNAVSSLTRTWYVEVAGNITTACR